MAIRNGNGVREERTGWRDQWISQRHRRWGSNCPAVDIDFLAIEYDLGRPLAVVDYKALDAYAIDLGSASFRALSLLADNSNIPFMVVFYDEKTIVFTILPVNNNAKRLYQPYQIMSEQEYVASLYRLRGRAAPESLIANLSSFKP